MISSSLPLKKQPSDWLTYLVYQLEACFFGGKLLEFMFRTQISKKTDFSTTTEFLFFTRGNIQLPNTKALGPIWLLNFKRDVIIFAIIISACTLNHITINITLPIVSCIKITPKFL